MCGLAGFFSQVSQASNSPLGDLSPQRVARERELLVVRDTMLSRGPDGAGCWISYDGSVGLAHRRLSILDLSDRAAQPMALLADGPEPVLRIVFNGEVYNFRELREELESTGHRLRSTGDTEVLLALYREYGPAMVKRLRGMFAFAIYDPKRHEVFLARDPMGIKPLYVATVRGTIHFASQVKALTRVAGVDLSPDPAGTVSFYLWGSVSEPYTMYKGIRALPAGCTMLLRRDGVRQVERYADPVTVLSEALREPTKVLTAARRDEILHDALRDTVRNHMISDVPVALFLSAGLDSASLLGLMSEIDEGRTRSLTLGFDVTRGSSADETELAKRLAAHYGANHESVYVGQNDFADERERLLDAMDQPTIDGINTYFISRMSHQAGYKVAISGVGGDELFAGYPSFRDIPRIVRGLSPFTGIPGIGKAWRLVSGSVLKSMTSPKYAGLLEYGGSYGGAYLLRRGLYMPWELRELMDPELAAEGLKELHPILTMQQMLQPFNGNSTAIADRLRVSALELSLYMRQQLLRDSDWAGMAHSVEIRVPLVDYALLTTLAPLLASDAAPGKKQMAEAASKSLPAAIMNRPKSGFHVPVREWLMSDTAGTSTFKERGLRGWAKLVAERYQKPAA